MKSTKSCHFEPFFGEKYPFELNLPTKILGISHPSALIKVIEDMRRGSK